MLRARGRRWRARIGSVCPIRQRHWGWCGVGRNGWFLRLDERSSTELARLSVLCCV